MCTGADLGSAAAKMCDSRLCDGGLVRDCCRHRCAMRRFYFVGDGSRVLLVRFIRQSTAWFGFNNKKSSHHGFMGTGAASSMPSSGAPSPVSSGRTAIICSRQAAKYPLQSLG